MAGGPIYPGSVDLGTSGDLSNFLYQGTGGNAAPNEFGIGVIASLANDRTLGLRYAMPPVIPTGTLKLIFVVLANATSGAAKFTVSDGKATPATSPAASGNPSAVTLTAETQTTVTWAASENDRYKQTKVTLTTSPSGNDFLVVAVKFQTSGWTLAAKSCWLPPYIIWE